MISGFGNIGPVEFQRDLRFGQSFSLALIPKLLAFGATLFLALLLRNYWALVAGIMAGSIAGVVVSYRRHPFRPRISFAKTREIWSFSIWTLIRAIGFYSSSRVDQFAVGGFAGTGSMGRYSVAIDISSMPTTEVVVPGLSALYLVMARVQQDPVQLRALYLRAMSWSAVICAATSIGVCVIAGDLVALMLGPQWSDVTPLMPWLAIAAGLLGLSAGAYGIFDATGSPQTGARLQWLRLTYLIAAIAPTAYFFRSVEIIAMTRCLVTAVFMPSLFIAVGKIVGVDARDYAGAFWRPFLSAAIMAAAVLGANAILPLAGNLRLAIDVALGAATYGGALFALWTISGRPQSPEKDILAFLSKARFWQAG